MHNNEGRRSSFQGHAKAVEISRTELEGLDIVVANAGLTVYGQMLSTITDNQFKTVIDVNLVGAANTLRAAIPHLTEQKSGRIILVSSGAGRMGIPALHTIAQVNGECLDS